MVEEFLEGEEVSFFALIDGNTCVALTSAQDHKAVGDGDTGPNTGGMGAYSPAPVLTSDLHAQVWWSLICSTWPPHNELHWIVVSRAEGPQVMETIIQRTADAMVAEGCPFRGVLFAGLMIRNGTARLLEHNVRFGDPECQVLMMRLESDLLEVLLAACDGRLADVKLQWSPQVVVGPSGPIMRLYSTWACLSGSYACAMQAALAVVMAASGYPGSYEKGSIIRNLDAVRGAKVLSMTLTPDARDCVTMQTPEALLMDRCNGFAGVSRRNEHK